MKWYIVVFQRIDRIEAKPVKPIQFQGWRFGMALSILAWSILACSFFSSSPQPTSPRVVILTRLPTLTSTPLQISSDSNDPAVVSPQPINTSVPTPIPTPTILPVVDNITTEVDLAQNQNGKPPLLTALIVLNIRTGPGVAYEVVGQLGEGQSIAVLGRNAEGTWWQIIYPPESGNTAWVSADAQYSTVSRPDEVSVAQAPDPPTATATAVPTNTPAATPTSDSTNLTQTPEATSNPTSIPTPKVMPTVPGSEGWFR